VPAIFHVIAKINPAVAKFATALSPDAVVFQVLAAEGITPRIRRARNRLAHATSLLPDD
jgi:hypothetical protein